ncbi:MAG: TonB-dependent receptor [Gammaproteobacteria bacterium]|nr:TonB-dependent receptor [Gammaproteobacteria bacterium]
MKSFRVLLTAACAIALPISSLADLGPIVITPTRTEQAQNSSSATVYVLDSQAIESSGATTTSQLLRGIPGLQVDDLFGNGTQVTISVRGFSTTANANTLVLVNGRRLNYSDTASPDIHHIFPKDIERIEVLVGSAGSLYGDQAVGGVVNIITKTTSASSHQVVSRVGSFDYKGVEFSSSMQLNELVAYRFSAGKFEADHYRDHNAEENSNFSGLFEFQDGGHRLFAEVQEIEDELELPGALLKSEFDDDPTQSNDGFVNDFVDEDTSVYRIGYGFEMGKQLFSLDTTRRETDADVLISFRNNPSPAAGFTKRENSSINPKLSGTIDSAYSTRYVVGIDLEETDFELEIPNVFSTATANNEQDNESLYFQINPEITDSLQLTFGMRRSSVENDSDYADALGTPTEAKTEDDVTVSEFGLAYSIDDDTRFTLRYDENFRFAKIDELSITEAGTELETQTGESIEIGIHLTRGDHILAISIYQLDLEDEIAFDPTVGPDFGFGPIGLNVNLDDTRRVGMTISLFSQISSSISLNTELGLVDARYESGLYDNNEISGVADEIARLRGDYQINDFFNAYLEYQYSSPKFAQGDNANDFGKLRSITVFNAGIGYQNKAWDVNFRINNLTDEEYAEFVTNNGFGAAYQPSPERNFMLAVGYGFE